MFLKEFHVEQIGLIAQVKTSHQDEDESHPFGPHGVHQGGQAFEVWAQNKVQLPLHVVDVCVLHVLQKQEDIHPASFIHPSTNVCIIYPSI